MNTLSKFVTGIAGLAVAGIVISPMAASAGVVGQSASGSPGHTAEAGAKPASGRHGGVALPDPDGARLVDTVRGEGVQVYECIANADGSGTWRNRPVATLRGVPAPRLVGTHDSVSGQGQAPVPQWSYLDGSRVVAQLPPLINQADPQPAENIAALRLAVAENSGTGRLAGVTIVQRDLVSGGVGPAGACTVGSDTSVVSEYSARYTFWTPQA